MEFGDAEIVLKNGQLFFQVGAKPESFLLKALNRDTFSFETTNEMRSGLTLVTFTIDETGIPHEFVVEAFNANGLGTFKKTLIDG